MDGHNSDDDIYPEVVDESDEEDESSFKRARTFGTHACVYISASVLDFYYNATPKAPPKREYGEAIRPGKLPAVATAKLFWVGRVWVGI